MNFQEDTGLVPKGAMENTDSETPQQQGRQQDPNIVYLQPGQKAVYLHPGEDTPAPPPTPPAGQWVYQQVLPLPEAKPKASGLRISAGILAVLLGVWNILTFLAFTLGRDGDPLIFPVGLLFGLHLAAAVAMFAVGIMIIAQSRRRSPQIPQILLGSAVAMVFVDFVLAKADYHPYLGIQTLAWALPTAVLVTLVLTGEESEKKSSATTPKPPNNSANPTQLSGPDK